MNEMHIQSAFDRDLEAIQAQIMKMGGLVEAAIMDAARSLERRDLALARTDVRITASCFCRLSTRRPVD